MRSLRWFPRPWRARYGAELSALLEHLDAFERSSWTTRFDLARAGLRERLRILAPGPLPPEEKAREGAILVLYAWMLFVVGGFALAKLSEHWQAVTSPAERPLPAHAFDVLYVAAGIGSALVVIGVAVSLPALFSLLRRGGWIEIRRPVIRALVLSALALGLTIGLSRWAHSLTPAQRNGSDGLYNAAFAAWLSVGVSCLFAWAVAAASVARRLELAPVARQLESLLAVGVGISMLVMTTAAMVWWAALANVASIEPNMLVASMLIVSATALGLIGAARSVRAG